MQSQNRHIKPLLGAAAIAALSSWLTWKALGQSVPTPVLKATLASTNQVNILITNGVSFATYELYWKSELDPILPWTLFVTGTTGQTNFGVLMNETYTGFFQAAVGTDWDSDGIPNSQDARPNDPAIGTLTVTIESPANGSTIN